MQRSESYRREPFEPRLIHLAYALALIGFVVVAILDHWTSAGLPIAYLVCQTGLKSLKRHPERLPMILCLLMVVLLIFGGMFGSVFGAAMHCVLALDYYGLKTTPAIAEALLWGKVIALSVLFQWYLSQIKQLVDYFPKRWQTPLRYFFS